MKKNKGTLFVLIVFLTGCTGMMNINTAVDAGPKPNHYQETIQLFIQKTLKDPYSLRDFNTGQPVLASCSVGIYGPFHGWRVPVQYNAKNSFGAYTGLKTYYYWFHGETLKGYNSSPTFCPEASGWKGGFTAPITDAINSQAQSITPIVTEIMPGHADEIKFDSLPTNTGGISIRTPDFSEVGNVVPVEFNLAAPLNSGDKLLITGDNKQAMIISTAAPPVSMVSTRLRLRGGQIGVYAIRKNGQVDSKNIVVGIGSPANEPPAVGVNDPQPLIRSDNNEVKMLFKSAMAINGYIKDVIIQTTSGSIFVTMTPVISMNPYLGIESTRNLQPVTITATTNH